MSEIAAKEIVPVDIGKELKQSYKAYKFWQSLVRPNETLKP